MVIDVLLVCFCLEEEHPIIVKAADIVDARPGDELTEEPPSPDEPVQVKFHRELRVSLINLTPLFSFFSLCALDGCGHTTALLL